MHAPAGLLLLAIVGCGGSTDVAPTRYNFGIVDGGNQASTAGTPTLAKPVTSQLTRDPNGKFASRVLDFFAPAIAYAQSLTIPGDPVASQLVCGEETGPGEPKVVPLCAFTLADGKAANVVQTGTKAGLYTMRFTAQVSTQVPVKDSTTVTVKAGAIAANGFTDGQITLIGPAAAPDGVYHLLNDKYGNAVPYRILTDCCAHAPNATPESGPPWPLIADKIGTGSFWVVIANGDTLGTGVVEVFDNGTFPGYPGLQTNLWLNGRHP